MSKEPQHFHCSSADLDPKKLALAIKIGLICAGIAIGAGVVGACILASYIADRL